MKSELVGSTNAYNRRPELNIASVGEGGGSIPDTRLTVHSDPSVRIVVALFRFHLWGEEAATFGNDAVSAHRLANSARRCVPPVVPRDGCS